MYNDLKISAMHSYEVIIHAYCRMTYIVIARNRSSALYRAYQAGEYAEYISYVEFIKDKEITKSIRKLHPAILGDLFEADETLEYCRKYRGMQFLQLGMKVKQYDGTISYIIGSEGNLKAYIPEFDKTVIFHPTWKTTYFDEGDNVIADYRKEK